MSLPDACVSLPDLPHRFQRDRIDGDRAIDMAHRHTRSPFTMSGLDHVKNALGYKNPAVAAIHSMPIWIAPADTRRWLIATATGHLSLEDVVTFIMTHRTGERLRWPLLFDASATTTDIAPTEVEQLARAAIRAKEQAGEMRAPVALIAPADPSSSMLM